jgi:hypothetical protein
MTSLPKVGETREFKVGDKVLIVEPIPYGNLKKIIKLVAEASVKLDPKQFKDDYMMVVPVLIQDYVDQIVPLLFRRTAHEFMTQDWVDENLTVPTLKSILIDALYVNGLSDFFLKTVKVPAPAAVASPSGTETPQSQTGNSGSTTSSDSPTDGGPTK